MYELIGIIDKMLRRLKNREGKKEDCEPDTTYSDWLIIKLWLITVLEGWTVNVLYAKLRREKMLLRQRYRLPTRLPSRSTVYERLRQKSLRLRMREFFHESTRYALGLSPPEETHIVAIDLTSIAAHTFDPSAAWGYRAEKDVFWGYKLGLVVTRSGIPLAFRLIPANRVEGHVSVPLLNESTQRLKETSRSCEYVPADKGFDAEKNYRTTVKQLQAILVCPGRKKQKKRVKHRYHREYFAQTKYPYRTAARQFYRSPRGRAVYRQRNIIEQVNGQLKDSFRLDQLPRYVVGRQRMHRWCLGVLIFYTVALIANRLKSQYNRQLKAFAA